MIPEPSLNDRVAAFNARLKADGIYEGRDPWSLPTLYEGSILDIPETPESRERIEWLKQQIAELQRQRQDRDGAAIKETTGEGMSDQVREITDPVSTSAPNAEVSLTTTKS